MTPEPSPLIRAMQFFIRAEGLPTGQTEYRFDPDRKFRFDLCWPEIKVAFEGEGGSWSGGRHVSPKGFERDCEKYSLAAILGWCCVRATTTMIDDGRAIALLKCAIEARTGVL